MSEYRDWREFLPEGEPAEASLAADASVHTPSTSGERFADIALPDDISQLMAEQARLQAHLTALTGKAPPTQDEQRESLRFPVKAHTKESRLEERRLRRHDERMQMAKRRSATRAALRARAEEARERARMDDAQARRQAAEAERRAHELTAQAKAEAAVQALLLQKRRADGEAAAARRTAEQTLANAFFSRLAAAHECKLARKRQEAHELSTRERIVQRALTARREDRRAEERRWQAQMDKRDKRFE